MSPSVNITRRETSKGEPRWIVRYRVGGRAFKQYHAGSFATLKEARARRDFVSGEIAAGRDPAVSLRAQQPREIVSVSEWRDRFIGSRIDADANTIANYRSGLKAFSAKFGDRDPQSVSVGEVAEWVGEIAQKYRPGTVRQYVIAARLLLDFVGVDPNPARDPKVRLPKEVRSEHDPPSADHVLAMLAALGRRWRLMFVTIEQGALRVGEAASLTWGDVDVNGLRLRLPRTATKRDRARWVYLPEWLMELLDESCPLEDRTPERRVFQGISEASFYQAMNRACTTAKVPHYSPHDLRHRRITVWHQSGVVARELAERAGHANASMSLDVYSHVMPLDEVPAESFTNLVRSR